MEKPIRLIHPAAGCYLGPGNTFCAQNGVNGSFLSFKSVFLDFKSFLQIFRNCTRWLVFKRWKMWLLGFLRNILIAQSFCFCSKLGNGSFLGPKWLFLNLSLNLFIRFFWNYIRWQACLCFTPTNHESLACKKFTLLPWFCIHKIAMGWQ